MKSVVERILALTGQYELRADFDAAADAASFALCTLDDMLDWCGDFKLQRCTYPIQRAMEAVGVRWTQGHGHGRRCRRPA